MSDLIERLRVAWCAFFGGDIGGVGWCGQDGYWWTRPCPHYYDTEVGHGRGGCGWYDGIRVVVE